MSGGFGSSETTTSGSIWRWLMSVDQMNDETYRRSTIRHGKAAAARLEPTANYYRISYQWWDEPKHIIALIVFAGTRKP